MNGLVPIIASSEFAEGLAEYFKCCVSEVLD
ncbi:hypothetical protein COLO4_32804 [Corchorus olitorius]|uniref:Uncharacterized protein n=1 Tax=Corchorus olitorius TaxID=93759 RepID=A0A1R3GXW9_9ROSI|nr:hypothetical protein COLO4_32804 [Corchorus olitorius]